MPSADSSTLIVARFLKSNHYMDSYNAFIREAGLPENAGDAGKNDLTLETLLEEKKMFDFSIRFEKLGTESESTKWSEPAPKEANAVATLPSKANLLSTSVETFIEHNVPSSVLLATSADRRLHILNVPDCTLKASLPALQDSPILSCAVLQDRVLLTTAMSGQLMASDLQGNRLDSRRDHSKYVVKVAVFQDNDEHLIATAGWDNKIFVYRPSSSSTSLDFKLGSPVSTITLPTKPEAFLFLKHPETHEAVILASRTDSSHIFYYTVESSPRLLGKQNLAPHSNAWVAFTPSSLALCPTDPSLLAVGTNSVPHMKVLILRLLVPPYHASPTPSIPAVRSSLLDDSPATETQASQARAALAIADREAAAIQIHCTTMAPQTPFSTPAVAWRPDGTGVWVNGDDGAVRGVEASTGKVICTLQGHEEGSKVRCLWAGWIDGQSTPENGREQDGAKTREEWMVSGGFDHELIVWKASPKCST